MTVSINPVVACLTLGLLAILLIATLGAAASRRFHFRYSLLSVVSLVVYTAVGFEIASKANLAAVIIAATVMGLFDGTVGWQLCLRFKANLSEEEQESLQLPVTFRVGMTIVIAIVCGIVGYAIAPSYS